MQSSHVMPKAVHLVFDIRAHMVTYTTDSVVATSCLYFMARQPSKLLVARQHTNKVCFVCVHRNYVMFKYIFYWENDIFDLFACFGPAGLYHSKTMEKDSKWLTHQLNYSKNTFKSFLER